MKNKILITLCFLLIPVTSFSQEKNISHLTEQEVSQSTKYIKFPKTVKTLEMEINALKNKDNENYFNHVYSENNTSLDQEHHKIYTKKRLIKNKEFELLSKFSVNSYFYAMSGYSFAASQHGITQKESEKEFVYLSNYQNKSHNVKEDNFKKYMEESNLINNTLKFNSISYREALKNKSETQDNNFITVFKKCHNEIDQSHCRSDLMEKENFEKNVYYKNFVLGIYLFREFHN